MQQAPRPQAQQSQQQQQQETHSDRQRGRLEERDLEEQRIDEDRHQRSGDIENFQENGIETGASQLGSGSVVDAHLGAGLVLKQDRKGFYKILEVVHSGAAYRSKAVKVGDILLMADGVSVKDMLPAKLAQMMLGSDGSHLELGLQRVDESGLLYVANVMVARGPIVSNGNNSSSPTRPDTGGADSRADFQTKAKHAMQKPPMALQPDGSMQCGIGLTFGRDRKGFFVVKALAPNGPASLANEIVIGDTLVRVDGSSVKGIRYDELTPLILGPEGSLVVLGLRRQGAEGINDVHLRRGRVGLVGRPSDRRSRIKAERAARAQQQHSDVLQPLPEDDERENDQLQKVRFQPQSAERSTLGEKLVEQVSKCGMGLTFRIDDNNEYCVVDKDPLSDQAGARGVAIGDVLVSVDGQRVQGMGHADLSVLMLGPQGTVAMVGMRRANKLIEYSLELTRCKPVLEASKVQLTSTKLFGVGVDFEWRKDGHHCISGIQPGGSAHESGKVHVGDVVLQAAGRVVSRLTKEQLVELVEGKEGTWCVLMLKNQRRMIHEVRLLRAAPGLHAVQSTMAVADGWDFEDQMLDGFMAGGPPVQPRSGNGSVGIAEQIETMLS